MVVRTLRTMNKGVLYGMDWTVSSVSRFFWSVSLSALLLVAGGCERGGTERVDDSPGYVTTIPPFEAILGPVIGQRGTVKSLLPPGSSPHTYEVRPSDARLAGESTALFYGAPDLDEWVTELDVPARIALLDFVPDSLLLTLPGGGDAHHPSGIDPHFWMDPVAVRAVIPALADTLCGIDPPGCRDYRSNAQRFSARLDSLDSYIRTVLEPAAGSSVLLAQPFFLYFANRYGIALAGIVEPIPGKEPSPRYLQELVAVAKSRRARAIFTQSQLPSRSAQAVAEGAGVPLFQLDPLGGGAGRTAYVDLLRYNTDIVREALR